MPRGFCPVGIKQIFIDHQPTPSDDCPLPKSHADAMALYEMHKNDAISKRE
jgi:hypothetical protein